MTPKTEPYAVAITHLSFDDPESLTFNPENPKIHPRTQMSALASAMRAFGVLGAVLVNDQTGYVLDGHARIKAACEAGQSQLPVLHCSIDPALEAGVLDSYDAITLLALYDRQQMERIGENLRALDSNLDAAIDAIAARAVDLDPYSVEAPDLAPTLAPSAPLAERFIVPPFSVLDARQGYWQERKRAWLALGIQSELGRGDGIVPNGTHRPASQDGAYQRGYGASPGGSRDAASRLGPDGKTRRGDGKGNGLLGEAEQARSHYASGLAQRSGQDLMRGEHTVGSSRHAADMRSNVNNAPPLPDWAKAGTGTANMASGTSIFDPVLCELAYRWFCPPTGHVLDPFAGGSVRGIVAALLGRNYTGIDLSARQLAANEDQAADITPDNRPRWLPGDAAEIVPTLAAYPPFDLLFTCPPYADLEVYSDDPRDLSGMPYDAFLAAYRAIIAAACDRLADDRFACVVIGDVRDRKGIYRNLPAATIAAFADAGLALYNEAILVTAVGSLSIRVGRQFSSGRKLGKTHQQVYTFIKGDPKRATEACGPVEVTVPDGFGGADAEEMPV
jgi:hypothetical protein